MTIVFTQITNPPQTNAPQIINDNFELLADGGIEVGDMGDIVVSGPTWSIDPSILSAFGRTLTDDADAAAARSTLGLGTVATLASDTDGTLAANSDLRVATQKAVKTAIATAIANLIGAAPGVLDTLGEISDAINDDANLYTTLVAALALKSPLASPAFTGNPTAPTPSPGDNDTSIATTAFVMAALLAGGYGTGDVVGPGSAIDGRMALFDGTTGKLIKVGGAPPTGTNTGDETTASIMGKVNAVTALSIVGGVVNIDCALGDYFTLALSANVTSITFSNLPGSGKGASKWVEIVQGGSYTVAWPASFKWAGGTAGAVSVTAATDELGITTVNNGTTWKASLGKAFA